MLGVDANGARRRARRPRVGRVDHAATTALDVALLAEEHRGAVLAFAHGMLGSRQDAEDATQEAFLRAHREAASFRGECAPRTWLFTIARHVCLDRLRHRAVRRFATLDDVVAHGSRADARPSGPEVPADDAADRRGYVAAVREGCLLGTLACLSPDQRTAFVLRTLTDLGTSEVAEVLGRSPNAVRVLVHRARARLKQFLCRHCTLWDPANPCRCENLVAFSLARGWIAPDDARSDDAHRGSARPGRADADAAARAVDDVARLAGIYAATLGGRARDDAAGRLRDGLAALEALAP